MSYRAGTRLYRVVIYVFLIVLLLICVIPLWILIVNATRTTSQIQSALSLIPGTNLISNYNSLMGKGINIFQGFINSCIISVSSTILCVYFSMMTAYAITVYNFKLKKAMYVLVVLLVMVPAQISVTGIYQYMATLHLLNSYVPLIIPAIASAGTVFFGAQYFKTAIIPEVVEAARIDGCSEFGIFNRVIMPIAVPGAFTMGIFAFVASWNNLLIPFTLLSKNSLYTLPMVVNTLKGNVYSRDYGAIYFGMAITVVPIIIVYLIFSKYIISGISLGSVKE